MFDERTRPRRRRPMTLGFYISDFRQETVFYPTDVRRLRYEYTAFENAYCRASKTRCFMFGIKFASIVVINSCPVLCLFGISTELLERRNTFIITQFCVVISYVHKCIAVILTRKLRGVFLSRFTIYKIARVFICSFAVQI